MVFAASIRWFHCNNSHNINCVVIMGADITKCNLYHLMTQRLICYDSTNRSKTIPKKLTFSFRPKSPLQNLYSTIKLRIRQLRNNSVFFKRWKDNFLYLIALMLQIRCFWWLERNTISCTNLAVMSFAGSKDVFRKLFYIVYGCVSECYSTDVSSDVTTGSSSLFFFIKSIVLARQIFQVSG